MVHIGFIPDGNRRWCKKNDLPLTALKGTWCDLIGEAISSYDEKIDAFLKDSLSSTPQPSDVTEVTVYLCSIDNVRRNDRTMEIITAFLKELLPICSEWLDDLLPGFLNINIIGSLDELDKSISKELLSIREKFCTQDAIFTLNLAIAYDFEKDVCNYGVYTDDDYDTRRMSQIDIIIRTGGEKRTSGFFPTKSYYAELYFSKKLWPEFSQRDFQKALRSFRRRRRRFGA